MTETIVEQPLEALAPSLRGLDAWRAFLQAHATIVRRLEADLEASGLPSLADLDVLMQLAEAPERRLRMSDLAEEVLLSRSGMTRRIDRLEAAGLVARHECSSDRRGAWAMITDAGLERLLSARPTQIHGVNEHFVSKLTDDDLVCLRQALDKVAPPGERNGTCR
ncbi:MAG TPA: MarR family transcriptional regulator [Candidatus Saccharimonadales bacterium]|nr:MarR family transcriptional regulator [Candidatus Saccharimonadales bacterium]